MPITELKKKELCLKLEEELESATSTENDEMPSIHGIIAGVTGADSTIFLDAKGYKCLSTKEKISKDNIVSYFSCTKSITAMGLLVLYEQNKVDLDVPAKIYLPRIDSIGLIEKGQVSEIDGSFLSPPRRPKVDITLRHLLCHTAGFAYAFMNTDYYLLSKRNPGRSPGNPNLEFYSTESIPLLHEPGTDWLYGHSFDWIGLIIEAVTSQSLGEFLEENIFKPIGMHSCTFHVKDTSNMLTLYKRTKDGSLKELAFMKDRVDPLMDLGGQGCHGSVEDYLKFMRVWLNYGYSPDSKSRILKEDTVKYAIKNHLPSHIKVSFEGTNPLGGTVPDGFTLTGNAYCMSELATGRPESSIYWAGLANLYYWIDFKNKVAGFWGTQVLPTGDMESLVSSMKFEYQVYKHLKATRDNKI